MTRKPRWSRDETILALDKYLTIVRRDGKLTGSPEAGDVQDLLSTINRLAQVQGRYTLDDFRNGNGVLFKMMEFYDLDPDYHGLGAMPVTELDRQIWQEFSGDPKGLRSAVAEILKQLK